jgi:hypothetical protein
MSAQTEDEEEEEEAVTRENRFRRTYLGSHFF